MDRVQEQLPEPRPRPTDGAPDTVWELIRGQAEAHPARTALIDGEREIDYARLIQRADAIAGELAARGVEPGSLVGVCMGRSWELVAALVGVLRASCAYVPLDPAYPRARLRYMLEHSRAAMLLVDSTTARSDTPDALGVEASSVLCVDKVGEASANGRSGPSARDLAYVMYTSGSTGRPKGVAIEHRSVVAMTRALRGLLDDEELAGMLAAASICFDASVMEIFGTLSLGGTMVLAESVLELPTLPAAHRVRASVMVPSTMQALLTAGRPPVGLRRVLLGGEVLKPSLVERLQALDPPPRVVNVYGPTEDTVFSTTAEVAPGTEPITIGTSVPGSRAYILDESLQPLTAGEPGELFLAGDQLARGYLHDDELTAERFLEPEAHNAGPRERLYRTGDLCAWRADGEIDFLGRLDQQVKLRGYRIELEEIESVLETMPGVDGAAAAVVEGAGGQQVLAAYVVGPGETERHEAPTRDAVRRHAAGRLPAYMVPQVVVPLDELPRLPNDKLDRNALPRPDFGCQARPGAHERLADLSRAERRTVFLPLVRAEVASLLGAEAPELVPADQSLSDLGLDSLTTVELSSRLAALLGRTLPVAAVSEESSIVEVAEAILEASADGPEPVVRPRDADPLGRFQAQIRSCYAPFLAAKASAWSATDKGTLVRELTRLVGRPGRDSFSKFVRTGSAHRGVVADAHTAEEREAIIWTTNLYLGLNRDPEVVRAAGAALEQLGTGMGTSAVAAGFTDLHVEFERGFAELVGKPAACLFPTGYTANVGAIAGLLGKNDVVVMDQLCHASIVDGARLCGAKIRTFRHNDAADLETVLAAEASPYRTLLVVLEGVYSMGEGTAPVADIARTAKRYDALVLVDESHSFGFYGPRGAGLCAEQGATEQVDFVMTTLSKALGSLGGVVAARAEHVALLKSSARAYIFQASASPADIAAACAALRRVRSDDTLRERLWDTTAYMRERFSAAGYDLGTGDGPIVTPHFPDTDKLFAIVGGLFERGIHTSAVTYPIVEPGKGRLRFICSAAHSRDDVDQTLEALIDAERAVDAARTSGGEAAGEPALCTAAESPNDADSATGRPEVEAWARALIEDLENGIADAPGSSPNLAVSFQVPDEGEPLTIAVDEGKIGLRPGPPAHLPASSLSLLDDRAVESLCTSDVQGLLESIVGGSCRLSGEVEPFVWLVARMAAR
ncbi:MAG: amino acid adenylation domain-containing protein [Acidobacteriota bacterium]